MKKRDKGISLISLTVAVCILIVLSSMLLYNAKSGVNIRKLKMMQNDIATLDDAIDSYYAKYGALPTKIEYDVMPLPFYDTRNPNDNDVYYVIDLTALEGITLNYGVDYKYISTPEDLLEFEDFYVINEQSHQIYYARGIEMDGVVYYGSDADEVIELNEKKWLKVLQGYENYFFGLDTRGNMYVLDEGYSGTIKENEEYTNAFEFNKMIQVSAGNDCTIALDKEGKVYTWGEGGCLGNGTDKKYSYNSFPICISEIPENELNGKKIVEISAGNSQKVVLDNEGKVYTWGDNIGDGMSYESYIPICISEIEGNILNGKKIVKISAGDSHTVALDEDGKVYTWGYNSYGQLGDGTTTYSSNPICISDKEGKLLNGKNIVKISAGYSHTVALDEDGKVYTWGYSSYGQLGNGTTTYSSNPICISDKEGNLLNGKNIVEISAGDSHTVALDEDGKVYTWGYNSYGQLGNGTTTDSNIPICISDREGNELNGKKIVGISAGYNFTVAIDDGGQVYTWGSNYDGRLGDGTTTDSAVPICISDIEGNELNGKKIVGISAGKNHTVVLDEEGKFYTWGDNEYGQLGNGTSIESGEPICINERRGNELKGKIVDFAVGRYHIVAIDKQGKVYTWGKNSYGQLGDGTTTDSAVPICISDIQEGMGLLNNKIITQVSAGEYCTVALDKDGLVYIWGSVRNSTSLSSWRYGKEPTPISWIEGPMYQKKIVKISAGKNHIVAIDEEGKVYTWGINNNGQLGNGTTGEERYDPICISDIEGNVLNGQKIVEISAGDEYTIAVDEKGKVYEWYDSEGPVCISEQDGSELKDKNVVKISAGYDFTVALDEEGKVYTWGDNEYGQLGDGTTTYRSNPICISDIEGNLLNGKKIVEILAGEYYTTAIDENGKVFTFGKFKLPPA